MKQTLLLSILFYASLSFAQVGKKKIICNEKDAVNSDFTFTNRDCTIFSFAWNEANNKAVRGFNWSFGDGTSSTKPTPEHMYANGTFKVQLIVNGKPGCADTTIKEITVNKPKADFSYNQKEPGKVSFITKNAKLSHSWDFGDGVKLSNEATPVHVYTESGIYNVELFVQNDFGCIDILYKPISITLPSAFATPVNKIQLEKRSNNLVKEIFVEQDSVKITLYDNGEIDGDSISLIYNNVVVAAKKRLTANPLSYTLKIDRQKESNELAMYAENLGSIPPNTALMVIYDGYKRYEISVSSTSTSNGVVSFRVAPKK